jgi:pSer/pThr/pTyr-binding forkhead associated (FHA) protein
LDGRNATLQDAGGANGTLLNGVGVTQPTTLQDGDQIGLGEVLLTVRLKRR